MEPQEVVDEIHSDLTEIMKDVSNMVTELTVLQHETEVTADFLRDMLFKVTVDLKTKAAIRDRLHKLDELSKGWRE